MGLEVPFIFSPLSLVVLTTEKLIKASQRLDQMISSQTGEGAFGAYILTAAFWPGRSEASAAAAAERKGLSQSAAIARQQIYNAATTQVAALPGTKKGEVVLSLGASILHRQSLGFADHLNHVARGRLVQVNTVDTWDGINGQAAGRLWTLLGVSTPESELRASLADFQVRPQAEQQSVRQKRMDAGSLLRALLGEE